MAKFPRVPVLGCFAIFGSVLVIFVSGESKDTLMSMFAPPQSSENAYDAARNHKEVLNVVVVASIRNHLDTKISEIKNSMEYGRCVTPLPFAVNPHSEEIIVFRKTAISSPYGTGGIFTFNVNNNGTNATIATIYSNPHPFGTTFSKAWFGLAVIDNPSTSLTSMYNQLYYDDAWKASTEHKMFAYAYEQRRIAVSIDSILVTASMQKLTQSILQIDVTQI